MRTKWRFTIRFLLAMTALVGVTCAALRYPTKLCVAIAFSTAIGLLLVAVVGAFTSRGGMRAFFVGFAIVGWGHMILAFTPYFAEGTSHMLVSRYCLDQLARPLGYGMSPNMYIEEKSLTHAMMDYVAGSPPALYYKYLVIGQSLITLFLAAAGGALGRYFYHRSHEPTPESER
jgi:hypothetical protein